LSRSSLTPQKLALIGSGLLAMGLAYRPLLTLGTRYGGVEQEVGEWLMAPNDQAPLIVLVLAGWLAYRRWSRLRALPTQEGPLWAVGALFAFGLAVALWATYSRASDLLAISFIANLGALLLLQWGAPGVRVMWVPLAFLLLCIPTPAPLLVTILWELRLATAEYTGWILYVLGLPAFVSGDQIVRAAQNFQVIEGCSGLRSMETLTMLVVLMIDLFDRRGWHAAVLLVAAPIVAFAMNGLRVLTLILNPHSEIATVHSLQGIAILLVGLLLVYLLDLAIEAFAPSRSGNGAATPLPVTPAGRARGLGAFALLAVGVATAVATHAMPEADYPVLTRVDPGAIADTALGDGGAFEERSEDLYFHGRVRFARSVHRRYARGITDIEVFIGTGDRRDRRTSIWSPISRVPGSGWLVRETWTVDIDGRPVEASLIEKGIERRLVYRWREGFSGLLAESLRGLVGIDRSPFGRTDPIVIARITTPAPAGLDESSQGPAARRLDATFRELAPAIAAAIAAGESP
jgi:exosortase